MSWHGEVSIALRYSKSHLLYAMENGNAYATSVRIPDVADDSSIELLLTNPQTSNKNICWTALVAASEGKAYLDMYGQVTTNDTGTSLYQTQKFAGSSKTSVADTEYNGSYSYTSANLIYQTLVPGGGGPHSVGGEAIDAELAMASPNHNVLISLTNKAGSAKDMSLRIVWIDC